MSNGGKVVMGTEGITTWFLLALDQLYTYHMFEMEPIRI